VFDRCAVALPDRLCSWLSWKAVVRLESRCDVPGPGSWRQTVFLVDNPYFTLERPCYPLSFEEYSQRNSASRLASQPSVPASLSWVFMAKAATKCAKQAVRLLVPLTWMDSAKGYYFSLWKSLRRTSPSYWLSLVAFRDTGALLSTRASFDRLARIGAPISIIFLRLVYVECIWTTTALACRLRLG
jgi:hypothetical protein